MAALTPKRNCVNGETITPDQMNYAAGGLFGFFTKDASVEVGDCVIQNESTGVWETAQDGVCIYDGNDIVGNGHIVVLSGLTPYYSYYVQEDGSIGLSPTNYIAGFSFSETHFYVNILNGGRNSEYSDNMILFTAIPGKSGTIRLRINPAATAEGVLIKRSTSPYDDSGISWGDEVIDITDWSDCDGNNEWYDDNDGGTGLANGTRYYYKAFPYVGSTYNVADGHNETSCKAGGLLFEFTYDSISGSTLEDTSGNGNDGTNVNVSTDTGKVGEGGDYNGSSAWTIIDGIISAAQMDASFTITGVAKTDSASSEDDILCGHQYRGLWTGFDSSRHLYMNLYNGGDHLATGATAVSVGELNSFAFWRSKSSGMAVYLNNVIDGTSSYTGNAAAYSYGSRVGAYRLGFDGGQLNGMIDQLRFFTRALEDYEMTNIYNLGAHI